MQTPPWTCGRGPTRGGVLEWRVPFRPRLQVHGEPRRRATLKEPTKRGEGEAGNCSLFSLSLPEANPLTLDNNS